jgi:hypothetical protein
MGAVVNMVSLGRMRVMIFNRPGKSANQSNPNPRNDQCGALPQKMPDLSLCAKTNSQRHKAN